MKFLMTAALVSLVSLSAFASPQNQMVRFDGETHIIKLTGRFATVTRENKSEDDKVEIRRCGKQFSVLLLNDPIVVSLTSPESGEKIDVVVQYLRTWGEMNVKELESGFVEVTGVIGEETLGLCSPGMAIFDSRYYPLAK
ncbi:hypothetical protein [Bdellovibrio sp. HCB274]|uniref:hypothetical protein n=1 Tax=Bdellovibrio sp. HCB274 TaxID=3394361 RepID=UPI0039B472F9